MSTEDRVLQIIAEQFECSRGQVTLLSDFTQDLGADEIAVIELMSALENEFGVQISNGDPNEFRNAKGVLEAIALAR
ncbi:acyl carrier protein [Streptomyces sp. NBC_01764]|uniref:acyl carrier protein n=1 Tax=Streptomyces sp. NBC_01764 TaxID=2975935 RepID=UPI0022535069|nr:acyl carrier protein [Streptomyces sp. NBC_01764]MCX4404034.1 acyl carrier protein [Streptomyces sp. NBC_01764]